MSPLREVALPPFKAVAARAALIFLASAVVAFAILSWVQHMQIVKVRDGVISSENRFVEVLSRSLAQDLLLVVTDLDYLSQNRILNHYLNDPRAENLRELELCFFEFAGAKRQYDQARYLDASGMEIVRVNWFPDGAVVVPESELQNKADRYYFTESVGIPRGGLYISPLDLNIEKGKIEEPHKPMIRLAAPVFDEDGNRRGIVILNYLARRFLAELDRVASEAHGDLMLLNAEGYWLNAPDADLEWGFMFPNGKDKTFGNRHPSAWEAIRSKPGGILDLADGLYFFNRIRCSPKDPSEPYSARLKAVFPEWIVVSHITPGKLDVFFDGIREMSLLLGGVGLAGLIIGSWIIARTTLRRASMERAMREREMLYRTLAEHFPNGMILLLDRAMKCVLAEGRGLSLLGVEREHLEGCEITRAFPEQSREAIRTRLRDGLTGRDVSFELTVEGNVLYVHVVPVKGLGGEIFAEMFMTQDITERKRMEEQLREAATSDALTGLLNRRRFSEVADNMVRHARRYPTPLCLCMCDIDHFKVINDTHGHQVGDKVLIEYAALLRDTLRETDFIGRYGGDEFCVLLPGTPIDEAVRVVERVRVRLDAHPFSTEKGESFRVSGSFGIAALDTCAGGLAELFESADAALYGAKRFGRNQVHAFRGEQTV